MLTGRFLQSHRRLRPAAHHHGHAGQDAPFPGNRIPVNRLDPVSVKMAGVLSGAEPDRVGKQFHLAGQRHHQQQQFRHQDRSSPQPDKTSSPVSTFWRPNDSMGPGGRTAGRRCRSSAPSINTLDLLTYVRYLRTITPDDVPGPECLVLAQDQQPALALQRRQGLGGRGRIRGRHHQSRSPAGCRSSKPPGTSSSAPPTTTPRSGRSTIINTPAVADMDQRPTHHEVRRRLPALCSISPNSTATCAAA